MKFCVTDFETRLGTALCEAAGVNPKYVRSITLRLTAGEAGMLDFETFADSSILDADLQPALGDAEIKEAA